MSRLSEVYQVYYFGAKKMEIKVAEINIWKNYSHIFEIHINSRWQSF